MAAFLGTALGAALAGAATGAVLSSVLAPDPPEPERMPNRLKDDGTEMMGEDYLKMSNDLKNQAFGDDGRPVKTSTDAYIESLQEKSMAPDDPRKPVFGKIGEGGLRAGPGGIRPTATSLAMSRTQGAGLRGLGG